MEQKKNKAGIAMEIFDTMVIMVLCFGTLFSAMILKGGTIEELKYNIDFPTFSITILLLLVYLSYVLFQSEKGLRAVINLIYPARNTEGGNNKRRA